MSNGYGQIEVKDSDGGRRHWLAHRLVWHLAGHALPDHLHHRCGAKRCVNPDHLVPTDASAHVYAHTDLRTHCVHGHEFTDANTYWRTPTVRQCRACKARWMRERYARMSDEERNAEIQARSARRRLNQ